MPRVTGDIPNFINGISQQAPAMRLPSQAEISENYYPTVVDGAAKRPPTEFLALLGEEFPGAFFHIILRDDVEKYVFIIEEDGTPRVFDFEGNEKTLTNSAGTYLSTGITDAATDFRALTIADTTFVLNRNVVVAEGTATSDERYPGEALVNVLAGNYGKTYKIWINGVVAAEYQTPDGSDGQHTPFIDTSYIADQLQNDLVAAGLNTSPWAVGRYGNVIRIVNTSSDFTLSTEDGFSNKAMVAIKDRVQKFSDLPLHADEGIVFEIIGTDGSSDGDYFVKFEKTHPDNYAGVWRETVAKGTVLGLNQDTMPHRLVRNADDTWTLEPIEWEGRVAGSYETNRNPSFVGKTLEDITFHKNRLGLLVEENVVLSETGKFYNFFRKSVMTLLDTDVIDIAVSHVKVSNLHHAIPFNGVLLLFTEKTQFALKGEEILTPKSAYMEPLTELSSAPTVRPSAAGTSIYFLVERDAYASLYEYYLDKTVNSADAEDVAAHAPNFIPAGVRDIATSSDLNMVVVATSGAPSSLFLYKFLWNGQEKLQSAWVKWTLPGATILRVAFDRNNLVVLLRRNGVIRLETLNCEQGNVEYFHLDSRSLIASGTYDAGTDTTTFTAPFTLISLAADAPPPPVYPVTADFVVVTAAGGDVPAGVELTAQIASGTTFTVSGDYSSQPVYIGHEYTSLLRLSRQFVRGQDRVANQDGRLQLISMSVNYARAAYFRVEVTAEGRATQTYPFNGRVLSDPDNLTGEIVTSNGRLSFPVMSRADRVTIDLINDTWLPCSFIGAKWRGIFNPNSRQQ